MKVSKIGQVVFRPSQYFIKVTPDVLHYKNGAFTEGSTLDIRACKQGDEELAVGDKEVLISVVSDSYTTPTTSTTGQMYYGVLADANTVTITLMDLEGTKTYDTKTVLVIRDGVKGSQGAHLEMVQWEDVPTGYQFYSGAEGESVYHVVVYNKLYYKCLKTHTKGSTTPQNDSTNWVGSTVWPFIASDLLLSRRIAAEEIETENIVARRIVTEDDGGRIEISGPEMKVFGATAMNIRFGVNSDGMAVLEYYDNDGRKLYDLGPNGIVEIPVTEEQWVKTYMQRLGSNMQEVCLNKSYKVKAYSESYACYCYYSKVVAGVMEDETNNLRYFSQQTKSDSYVLPNGYYRMMPASPAANNMFSEVRTGNTKVVLTSDDLPSLSEYNELVYDISPLYNETIYQLYNGKMMLLKYKVYWNGSTSPLGT